jgi:ubiquinone/menaquinone biosynthesis C-methylase UbiE
MIYNKKYARAWIKNYESGKDIFRVKLIHPFLKNKVKDLPAKAKILDVGCGWGVVVSFLKNSQIYYGIDIPKIFFKYIKLKYKNPNIHLKYGKLPNKIDVPDNYFDLTIASMVLHLLPDYSKAIKILFKKTKIGGKVLIIDFRDSLDLISGYKKIYRKTNKYIKGVYVLPSGIEFESIVYFHKENELEKYLQKFGKVKKKYLSFLFVTYEIIKK